MRCGKNESEQLRKELEDINTFITTAAKLDLVTDERVLKKWQDEIDYLTNELDIQDSL